MIANIDFSIFQSPTKAYGNVTGRIDVPASTKIGDKVLVLKGGSLIGFDGWLLVTQINLMPAGHESLVGLDDLVVESKDDAIALSAELTRAGLFVDCYET